MKKTIFSFLTVFSFAWSVETLDLDMTAQERKKTGVYKLTEKEKAALQRWIDANYEKRVEPLRVADSEDQKSLLQENLQNGQYIKLANDTTWNIHPEDTNISQSWITPVDILITQSGDPDYPYKLTNTVTGSSLRAKKVNRVPLFKKSSS